MVSPFLEIELSSSRNKYLEATAPSKRPNASNPNFLQKLLLPVKLPLKSIYASPLQLRVRDVRLGGYSKPVVGIAAVELTSKLPWCPDTYKAPQTDIFFKGGGPDLTAKEPAEPEEDNIDSHLDEVGKEVARMQRLRDDELLGDGNIAMQEPAKIQDLLKRRVTEQDTGAGVFGAMNHITLDGKKKSKEPEAFVDPDWGQDDDEAPPEWSINREVLPSELEEVLKTTPFETYEFTRGQVNGGALGSKLKVVGKLKGLIRIIEHKDEPSLIPKELLDALFKPKGYKIRVYILKGIGLAPLDKDMFGKPQPSDPYVLVKLGKEVFNDRKHAVTDAVDVDLYKMIPFDAELPGTSQLEITLMDKNDFHSDAVIGNVHITTCVLCITFSHDCIPCVVGSTKIDLEDRWFDSRWQKLGEESVRLPSDITDQKTMKTRWQTKPIERRSLYIPSNKAPRGVVECWVDVLSPEVAQVFEPDDVSLPPVQMFEVRVVVWKSKNVPAMSFGGMIRHI